MSASCEPFVFQTTHLCHSVFSCFSPCGLFHDRLVASEKLATRLPPVVERISGSFPRFPMSVTLFKLRLTNASWRESWCLADECTEIAGTATNESARVGHFCCACTVPPATVVAVLRRMSASSTGLL